MSKAVSGPFGSVAAPNPPFWTLGHHWPSWNPEVQLSLTLGWSDIQAASPAAVTLSKSHCGGPRAVTVHSDCSFKPLCHVYNFNNRCNFKHGAKQPASLVLIPRPVLSPEAWSSALPFNAPGVSPSGAVETSQPSCSLCLHWTVELSSPGDSILAPGDHGFPQAPSSTLGAEVPSDSPSPQASCSEAQP